MAKSFHNPVMEELPTNRKLTLNAVNRSSFVVTYMNGFRVAALAIRNAAQSTFTPNLAHHSD
jgi:hypothetical protein